MRLLIHFTFSHLFLSTIQSGFCSTCSNSPPSHFKCQNQVFCLVFEDKTKQKQIQSHTPLLKMSFCCWKNGQNPQNYLQESICPQFLLYLFLCTPDTSAISHLLGLDMLLSMVFPETPSACIYFCPNNFYLFFSLTLNTGHVPPDVYRILQYSVIIIAPITNVTNY